MASSSNDGPVHGLGATAERKSERELEVTRSFHAPAHIVYAAWTTPELFRRWWVPTSFGMTLLSCEINAVTGGAYRLVFAHPASEQPMAFHGRYIEATPPNRLVWTNEEGGDEGPVTTVTFEERGHETLVVLHELYPSKEALDEAIVSGSSSMSGAGEQFEQLSHVLATMTR